MNPLAGLKTPADWQVLERIFTWNDSNNIPYQIKINSSLSQDQTKELILNWLKDIGYNSNQIKQLETDANSQTVSDTIKQNQNIVDNKIKTVKIPTIIFADRRHDGLVSVQDLH